MEEEGEIRRKVGGRKKMEGEEGRKKMEEEEEGGLRRKVGGRDGG